MSVAALLVVSASALGCKAERRLPPIAPEAGYPARLAAWPPAPWTGAIGRGPAPLPLLAAPVTAAVPMPRMRPQALWPVPGGDEARAIVEGAVGGGRVIEAIDVDQGRVRWRSDACAAVVHVVAEAVVCARGAALIGLDVDDASPRWELPARFVAASGELIVAATSVGAVVIDAAAGTESARFALPTGMVANDLVAACRRDGAVDVWAWSAGALARFDVRGADVTRAWSVAVADAVAVRPRIDPCDDAVLVAQPAAGGAEALTSYARRDGARLGGPVSVLGAWPARSGDGVGLELATATGLERRGRDLAVATRIGEERLGRLIASRGAARLVGANSPRGGAAGAVLLGAGAVRPLAGPAPGAAVALGDRYLLALPPGGPLQRWGLPAGDAPLAPPAPAPDERALPRYADMPAVPSPVSPANAIALPAAGRAGVAAIAVDPAEPSIVYAAPLEGAGAAGLAQLDARARRWRWHAAGACPAGDVVGVAATAGVALCATGSGVHAVDRDDGAPRWRWDRGAPTAMAAAGGAVAVVTGDELALLDAATGRELERVADDRGGPPRFALGEVGGEPLLVVAERGGVVARAARLGLLPRWALRVDGAVTDVFLAGDRVGTALATGELYLIDLATGGAVVAVGDYGRGWRSPGGGDLVVRAETDGASSWLAAFGLDGVPRFRTGVATAVAPRLALARGRDPRAPLVLVTGATALSIDPSTGLVTQRVEIGGTGATGLAFGTGVDGAPLGGVVYAQPLAIALF